MRTSERIYCKQAISVIAEVTSERIHCKQAISVIAEVTGLKNQVIHYFSINTLALHCVGIKMKRKCLSLYLKYSISGQVCLVKFKKWFALLLKLPAESWKYYIINCQQKNLRISFKNTENKKNKNWNIKLKKYWTWEKVTCTTIYLSKIKRSNCRFSTGGNVSNTIFLVAFCLLWQVAQWYKFSPSSISSLKNSSRHLVSLRCPLIFKSSS